MALLTIAIPTYARPRQIAARVRELLPQLTSEVEFVIYDNCSPRAVAQVVAEEVPAALDVVRIVRHPVNIGAVANPLRCIEETRTPWMWMLGDDDEVRPDAVENILALLAEFGCVPDLAWINCSSSLHRHDRQYHYTNTVEFSKDCEAQPTMFSNVLFASAGLCRTEVFHKYLPVAYRNGYSCSCFLPMLLAAMNNGATVLVTSLFIVDWQPAEVGGWNKLEVCQGAGAFAELDHSEPRGFHMARAMLRCHSWRKLFLTGIYARLMDQSRPPYYWDALFLKYTLYQRGWRKMSAWGLLVVSRLLRWFPFVGSIARRIIPNQMNRMLAAQNS